MEIGAYRRHKGAGFAWARIKSFDAPTWITSEGRFVIVKRSDGFVLYDRQEDMTAFCLSMDRAKCTAYEMAFPAWDFDEAGLALSVRSASRAWSAQNPGA